MIPTIDGIVAGLLAGTITQIQALGWLHRHVELAQGSDAAERREVAAVFAMQGLIACPATDMGREDLCKAAVSYADTLLRTLKR